MGGRCHVDVSARQRFVSSEVVVDSFQEGFVLQQPVVVLPLTIDIVAIIKVSTHTNIWLCTKFLSLKCKRSQMRSLLRTDGDL